MTSPTNLPIDTRHDVLDFKVVILNKGGYKIDVFRLSRIQIKILCPLRQGSVVMLLVQDHWQPIEVLNLGADFRKLDADRADSQCFALIDYLKVICRRVTRVDRPRLFKYLNDRNSLLQTCMVSPPYKNTLQKIGR